MGERFRLARVDLEDGQEPRHVEGGLDLFAHVQELQLGPEPLRGLEPGHELSEPGAVEEAHLGEVQQDPLPALGQELVDTLAQDLVAQARGEAALEVEDDDLVRSCASRRASALTQHPAQSPRVALDDVAITGLAQEGLEELASLLLEQRVSTAAFWLAKAAGSNPLRSRTRRTA